MNFKNLIFISYLFSFLIGQAISTPKTIKPLVELSAIDQFSLVTFVGAEGVTNSGGVVDYKTIKLYSITKNNNLVDYKQIFEFPLSEQSPSYFSGAHLGDITGDGENELILFISNPNTGTQIMSFTINSGFVFKKLHDPYLIKSNQKQPTLLSSGLATIYEDKDKEIVVSFGAPERKAVIVNYNGELESKVIAKNFLANSVGVIKILTPDLNEDNISDIYILSNSPNLKEEKIYLSPKHEDTNESTIVALKENIKDVCFVQINDDPKPSKVFLLNESKIYVENLDRYFDLPIKDSSLLTAVDNKNLFSMNKRGDLIIFRIFNNQVDIKESLVPGFKNNSYTETEYLILKNKSILLSHNGKAEIILQSLDSSQSADQAKKERQETIVVDTDKKTSLAGNDDEKATAIASLESVNQANMKQTKSGPVGVENKLDDILSQDKEKKNNTPKLNTTLTRDTIIVDVGENTVININLNKEYSFIGLEKEIGPKDMELDRSKLAFEWTPSSKELGYNELKYHITYNTSIEFEEYFEEGIQKLKQKETLSRSLYSTMIFVNAAPEIKVSPSNLYEIQAEEELIVPIYINDPNPEDQNLLTINMEPMLEGAKIENRKFYWTPRKKHLGTNNIKLNVSDGRLSDQVNIEVLVDTLKVESREVIEEYATVNEEFLHKIPMALDAKITIIEAPENVRISSDGYIHWIPTKPQLESNRIILEVKEKTQTFLYRLRVFVNAPPCHFI
ncbi:hypothetical protein OAQ87_00020 [Candidatus Marinimicrobia bacterium]|nr:hypothetical protein [Candidatus Neomarinimicrobiota bacterium]